MHHDNLSLPIVGKDLLILVLEIKAADETKIEPKKKRLSRLLFVPTTFTSLIKKKHSNGNDRYSQFSIFVMCKTL